MRTFHFLLMVASASTRSEGSQHKSSDFDIMVTTWQPGKDARTNEPPTPSVGGFVNRTISSTPAPQAERPPGQHRGNSPNDDPT